MTEDTPSSSPFLPSKTPTYCIQHRLNLISEPKLIAVSLILPSNLYILWNVPLKTIANQDIARFYLPFLGLVLLDFSPISIALSSSLPSFSLVLNQYFVQIDLEFISLGHSVHRLIVSTRL
ncbi:hypothetical protein PGTUg99_024817 [Puccinia graminis f. sp. tritici]|uniref:Uncharacterized protein n=1 Tax=Puccinia graminis f. sp. tritici TaxID=56615 RepID=A0A5B0NIQ0_PUCGR|nr:hypothetical protein PGTUg99_024817 [Puccinia graminis f. sp. tritici]